VEYLHCINSMSSPEENKNPMPTVLAWSEDPANVVRCEYIIMEHASGVQLHTHWPSMNGRQHLDCIQQLMGYMRELSRLTFPAYGCLYFTDAPLSNAPKVDIGDGFCVGPNCHPESWSVIQPRIYNRVAPNQARPLCVIPRETS
jgi:hypothetical protein